VGVGVDFFVGAAVFNGPLLPLPAKFPTPVFVCTPKKLIKGAKKDDFFVGVGVGIDEVGLTIEIVGFKVGTGALLQ